MEVDEIQTTQACKFQKLNRIGEEEEEEKENGEPMKTPNIINGGVGDGDRLNRWHNHSSRIIRVSRASGGKDRHSKVWTSKGMRDRRVRLSVATAIQFYDLQDRLGFDQPSKAVEWLINAAADSIAELPSLNSLFPDEEKMASNEDFCLNQNQNQNQTGSLSKSACSSNSETSKNSGSGFTRSEIRGNRVKARERAKVRTKEKEKESHNNPTFTELLTGSLSANQENPVSETGSIHPSRNWTGANAAPLDYFSSELEIPHQTVSMQMPLSDGDNHHHHHHHELSFIPDHLISTAVPGGGGSYNLDFNISCFNRGTLQSNSPQSFFSTLQRFSSDGSAGAPFFMGAPPAENLHHHHHQFQLYYDNGYRNSDQSKGKN